MPEPFPSAYDGDVQYAWDATSLSTFQTCPRLYKYSILDGWRPKSTSPHLLFGGWYAKALEHYFKYLTSGEVEDKEAALRRVIREALQSTWGAQFPDANGDPGSWISTHNAKTRENLIRSIVWYFDEFANDPTPIHIFPDGKPAVEVSFRYEIDHGLFWCGHLDRIVHHGGDLYNMDQKTSGTTITPRFFNQFKPDCQQPGYAFASNIALEAPVKGVIIDAVQIAVNFSRYTRGFVMYDRAYLEDWYHDALDWMLMATELSQRGIFPMNTSSCDKYGGCAFHTVCKRSPHVRDNFLAADFTQARGRWEPLEVR